MLNKLIRLIAMAVFAAAAQCAVALPYSVSYTDTITTSDSLPSSINLGQQVTTIFVLDNGNASTLNQTWNASDVQCVIFKFNNAQDRYVAIDYTASSFNNTTGSFATDGSGALTSAPGQWVDNAGPLISSPYAQNITGNPHLTDWYINAGNDVVFWTGTLAVGFNNVVNDTTAAYWTNPASAGGTCAAYGPYYVNGEPPTSIPTLSQWGMILMSSLLALVSIVALRRQRRS